MTADCACSDGLEQSPSKLQRLMDTTVKSYSCQLKAANRLLK
jgi:hypothetical protein